MRSLDKLAGFAGALATAAISLVAVTAPTTASAQQLEEITVTATRRAETDLQTTPVAVSAVSTEEFGRLFAQDIGEIATYVPGFSAATVTGFNAASFAMRGAAETDIIVYFDPKVGVIVDDFVVPHVQTQLLEPFDIESVEVLRGPQGTLFGKNTTSGAIVVRTKRPDLEEASFTGSVRYASFDDTHVTMAANLPLSDTMAFRIAAMNQISDGYYKNGKTDFPIDAFGAGLGDAGLTDGSPVSGDGSNIGGKDVFSTRAKLLWTPSEKLTLFGQLELIRDRSEPVPVVNVTPEGSGLLAGLLGFPGVTEGDPLDQAGIHDSSLVGLDGRQRVDVFGAYLNVEYEMDNHTFYGVIGQRNQDSRLPNEYLGTPYESFFSASRDDDRETFQLEGRIASENDGNLNYVFGGFYQTNDVDFCVLQQLGLVEFFGSAVPGVLDNANPLLICNRQESTAFAVFADLTYQVNDQFTISAGARYTDEEKDYIAREGLPTAVIFPGGVYNEPLDGQDFSLASFAVQSDSSDWQEPTYRLTGSYQLSDDVFGYATYTRGFKSGGYNDQAGSGGFANFPLSSYDPEFADSFEIGLKTDLWDGRARLNATIFTVTYEDFQRSTVVSVPGTAFQETRTFNAAEVEATGIELEFWAQLLDGLSLRANLGTLDATYNSFLLDTDNDGILDQDLSGRDVVRAPELTGGIDLTYVTEINNGAGIDYNLNVNFEDQNAYYYDTFNPALDTVLEERVIVNASARWTSADGMFYAAVFGKNLTDDRYKTASQQVGGLWTFANYGPPRTYGVEFGFNSN